MSLNLNFFLGGLHQGINGKYAELNLSYKPEEGLKNDIRILMLGFQDMGKATLVSKII